MRLPCRPWSLPALLLCAAACGRTYAPPPTGPGNYEDTGPLAACAVDEAAAAAACTLDAFDLSRCDAGSLAALPATGIFQYQNRFTQADGSLRGFGMGSLRLAAGAPGETLQEQPVEERRVGPGRFAFATAPSRDGVRSLYAGCSASADGARVQGCFLQCQDYTGDRRLVRARGTFSAERLEPAAEPEVSGLALVGEAVASLDDGRGMPNDVHVARGHAYVVSAGAGLFTFDLSDPAHPRRVHHEYLPDDAGWQSVAAKGDALYVSSHRTGVRVYDVRDPARPVFVRALPGTGELRVRAVQVDGDLLVATCPNSLQGILVFDVASPLEPRTLANFVSPDFRAGANYGPHDLGLFEGRAYVATWDLGLEVVDLRKPGAPVRLGQFRYPFSTSHSAVVGRFGKRLLAFEGSEDWGAHLRVLDVTDPARVHQVGEYRRRDLVSIHNFVLSGTRLYVAHFQDGVRVLDVSTPERPREVAHYQTWRPTDPGRGRSFLDGAVSLRAPGDGHVYVVDSVRGLLVLRETPERPAGP